MVKLKRGDLVVVWRHVGEALLSTVIRDEQELQGMAIVWVDGLPEAHGRHFVRPVTIHPSADRALAYRLVPLAEG